jgi:3-phenylpropionate/trans-cinnamate dioxygenase ferredoxin subunit
MPASDGAAGASTANPFLDVGPTSAVAPRSAVGFEASGRRFIVCNTGDDFYALADRCTHAAWGLAGSELRGCEIVCALHGASFDLRTGEATAPPASKSLRTFPVRVEKGRLLVQIQPPPT